MSDRDIFRKKSMDKVSSPEHLNDYIRVSNPGVWMVLGAIIILLIGVCVWGIFGRLDTVVDTVGQYGNGTLVCYVKEDRLDLFEEGLSVEANGVSAKVTKVSQTPIKVSDISDERIAYLGGFAGDDWVYTVTLSADLEEGVYHVSLVCESVTPISFVLN